MPDDNPLALDLSGLYERYLVTCAMCGIEPVSRERADGLIAEWQEVLFGSAGTDAALTRKVCFRP